MLGWEKESGDRADTNEGKQPLVSLNAEPHCPGIFRPREHSSQGKKGVPQAENRHVTLWLDSPSRLAVVTWQVPSARLLDRKIRSQGKVSFSLTMTMSPTCRTHGRQRCESKPVSGRRLPRTPSQHHWQESVWMLTWLRRVASGASGPNPGETREANAPLHA